MQVMKDVRKMYCSKGRAERNWEIREKKRIRMKRLDVVQADLSLTFRKSGPRVNPANDASVRMNPQYTHNTHTYTCTHPAVHYRQLSPTLDLCFWKKQCLSKM